MKIKKLFLSLMPASLFLCGLAHAYPVIDQALPTGAYPIKVYPDHQNPGVYWYIPISIEPWTRDSRYQSSLFQSDRALSFVFRGQASVDLATLQSVAKSLRTTVDNLVPIAYDYSKDLTCQNFFMDDTSVKWLMPSKIGNYLEVVPMSLRTNNPDLIEEISWHINHGGLACTVSVGFKAVSTGYKVEMTADLNRVYERFEAAAHAEGFWWEVDLHTLLESLRRDGVITIKALEDTSIPQTEIDKKIQASMDEVTRQIIAMMFTPALKLPNEPMAGRGKPWSLRADYRRSAEHTHYKTVLQSDKVQVKDSQIGIRMALQ